jgi:hypothetical protein
MHLKTLAAAASTAAVLAFAAPAMALTVTMDVNVTSASGVSGFTPFSFQETWTFSPTDSVNPGVLSSPVPGVIPATRHEHESFSGSPATTVGSPLTASLLTLGGLGAGDIVNTHVTYGRNTVFDDTDTPTSSNSTVEFFSSATVNTLQNDQGTATPIDDVFLFQSYQQEIEGFGNTLQTPAGMTTAGLLTYLAEVGPLQWSEWANQATGGPSSPMVFLSSQSYAGTATLVLSSAAPEPGVWALMTLGFGGLGAALRRKRTAVAA